MSPDNSPRRSLFPLFLGYRWLGGLKVGYDTVAMEREADMDEGVGRYAPGREGPEGVTYTAARSKPRK